MKPTHLNGSMSKAAYVASQGQTREHHCHWPGCAQQVPPAMWGCKGHWFTLPKQIRDAIWATYRPGQEKTMTPSDAYMDAAHAAQEWIGEYLAGRAVNKPAQSVSQKARASDAVTRDLFGDDTA